MHDFSSNTEPTGLECFCVLHARHARVQRLWRRFVCFVAGAVLVAMSFHELLAFLLLGESGTLLLTFLEAFGAYALLKPLFERIEVSTLERKTDECLSAISQL